ncbi:hypothetical protein Tco_0613315 [Tanacetum coccineum]
MQAKRDIIGGSVRSVNGSKRVWVQMGNFLTGVVTIAFVIKLHLAVAGATVTLLSAAASAFVEVAVTQWICLDLEVSSKAYEERLNEADAVGSIPVDLSLRLQIK